MDEQKSTLCCTRCTDEASQLVNGLCGRCRMADDLRRQIEERDAEIVKLKNVICDMAIEKVIAERSHAG